MERENSFSNVPQGVKDLIGRNLHTLHNHPLGKKFKFHLKLLKGIEILRFM